MKFIDSEFVLKLPYMYETFEKLDSLKMSLEGTETNILQLPENISAFRKKLLPWKKKLDH